jgi:hypothetical protein
MADIKVKYGTTTSLTISLNSLANGSIVASSDVVNTTDLFVDVLVELVIADVAEAGNKQVLIYASSSVDETNFSEAVAANRQQMAYVGAVSVNGTGPHRSRAFSVAAAFGGVIPPEFRIVAYNDSGVALASSGNSAQYRGVHFQTV